MALFNRNSETYNQAQKVMTFAGGTTNDPGDFNGTGNPATLFTVSGVVAMKLFALCTVDLAGAGATLIVGTAKNTNGLLVSTVATDLDANELWHDATPDASVELSTIAPERIVAQNVIQTAGTADITSGSLTYVCLWRPLTANATVVAA
jgi:hypothetical protein